MLPRLGLAVWLAAALLLGLCPVKTAFSAGLADQTMMMFIGEQLHVLTIASLREQSAWQAPAVAQVITRSQLLDSGATTLGDALEMTPGFYMAPKEWGTQPYLRGISDGALFLYDTVPMNSDTTRSINVLGNELSLASVKRVEIIRGPGSVLWGPDAFAGIVNVVPMTGKDLEGVESGVLYRSPGDYKGAYINYGHDQGLWNVFLSISGKTGTQDQTAVNLVRFWGSPAGNAPVPFADRLGSGYPDTGHDVEVSGCFAYEDLFSVSGRFSDSENPYAITRSQGDLTWQESQHVPTGYIKFEGRKPLTDDSAVRIMGYYQDMAPTYQIIDREFSLDEKTMYVEGIYDRSLLSGKGHFTAGVSYRQKNVQGAPIWDSYLPQFLGADNTTFLPNVTQVDYDSRLYSVFGQYTHKVGPVDLWLGMRQDSYSDYRDHFSYNTGLAWSISRPWELKLLYGSAYRTPYDRQLLSNAVPDLEGIQSLSFQLAWKPDYSVGASLVGFASHIENHIVEDPYAGLSEPNSQDIRGLEINGHIMPTRRLDLSAALTLLSHSGPNETYQYNDYSIFLPDGTVENHYEDLSYPYDSGPDTFGRLMATWKPLESVTVFARLNYHSQTSLLFPMAATVEHFSGAWTLDTNLRIQNCFASKLDLNLTVKNLTDQHYWVPGTYSPIEGNPTTIQVTVSKRW